MSQSHTDGPSGDQVKQNGSSPVDNSTEEVTEAPDTDASDDETQASISMGTMFGGVEVTGGSDDSLDDVHDAASGLMEQLAEEYRETQSETDDSPGSHNPGGIH